jgi:dTDP-4-dehydrorhamnose 3,5-epimerase
VSMDDLEDRENRRVKFSPTPLVGAWIIDLDRREDERGYFARTWCAQELADRGLDTHIAQSNTGFSPKSGTLRGLHYQRDPHAEVKIVRVARGAAFDVIVDLRPGSQTYCQWFGLELDAAAGRALYVPEGFAHGYQTLAPDTELVYSASKPYAPKHATGVRYDDPRLGIRWPIPIAMISAADRSWPDVDGAELGARGRG